MLEDLAKVAQEYGLKIHEGKTKALCNVQKGVSLGRLRFRNEGIKILCFEEADNYLGREVSFGDCQAREIENRLAAGWAAFAEHRDELFGKHYSLKARMKLFDALVSPSVLCGCAAWTLTTST